MSYLIVVRHWLVAVGLLTLSACANAADRIEPRGVKAGAYDRTYLLFTPEAVKADQPTPVVFAFHGAGGQGRDMLCCRAAAARHGWLLVCPDGLDHAWNAGSGDPAKADKSDSDWALCPAILAQLEAERKLDRGRIYATGFSNGGGMAARLAAHDAVLFTAVGSVGHTLTKGTAATFPPARPISVLIMIGSEEGLGDNFRAKNSLTAPEAAKTWAEFDHCGAPVVKDWPDKHPDDGTTVTETRYPGGTEGTEVVLLWVKGQGHCWPRGEQSPPPAPGKPRMSRELDAGDVIFDFFAGHRRDGDRAEASGSQHPSPSGLRLPLQRP